MLVFLDTSYNDLKVFFEDALDAYEEQFRTQIRVEQDHVLEYRGIPRKRGVYYRRHGVFVAQALGFKSLRKLADDELVEVTPTSIRMRKMILNKEQRLKAQSRGG